MVKTPRNEYATSNKKSLNRDLVTQAFGPRYIIHRVESQCSHGSTIQYWRFDPKSLWSKIGNVNACGKHSQNGSVDDPEKNSRVHERIPTVAEGLELYREKYPGERYFKQTSTIPREQLLTPEGTPLKMPDVILDALAVSFPKGVTNCSFSSLFGAILHCKTEASKKVAKEIDDWLLSIICAFEL